MSKNYWQIYVEDEAGLSGESVSGFLRKVWAILPGRQLWATYIEGGNVPMTKL